jgi:phosphopantetheine--protein transferase-like protein
MFDLNLKEGRCVGLRIDDIIQSENGSKHVDFAPWITSFLHPDEVKFAQQLSSKSTQKTFLGGRLALRHAMGCGINDCIILKDSYGRPRLPSSVIGSVSHKGEVAVALIADSVVPQGSSSPMGIGVDLEIRQGGHEGIARRILTPHERESLGKLTHVNSSEEVLLRFSIKEALYKAMHPLICQYVGFQEAECYPLDDGKVQVHLNLISGAHNAFETVSANWRIMDDYFLTTAQVQLKSTQSQSMAKKHPEECKM